MTEAAFIGMQVTNVENCCSSGSNAFREAYFAVALGRLDICLAVGVENLTSVMKGPPVVEDELEGTLGNNWSALYALRARRYMWTYGLKPEEHAKIAVINRRNAYHNEKASFGELIDIDTVLNSQMISERLHVYDSATI